MHKSFWMPRDAGCLADGEMVYDNSSRIEPKRGHQWLMDSTGPELFSNKKQVIESVGNRPVLGSSHMNASLWQNAPGFQSVSGQFSDRLFGPETMQTVNMVDRNIPSVGGGNVNLVRKGISGQFGSNCSMGMSTPHTIEDPSVCISFGGVRKVKVNQVTDNSFSASMTHTFNRGGDTISMGITHNKSVGNTISLGPTYNNGNENAISIGPAFSKADANFISIGHTFNKGHGNFMSMGQNYNKGDENILSMGLPFDKEETNFMTMGSSYDKGDNNMIEMPPSYDKGSENFISMGPAYEKVNDNFISMASTYDKEDANISSVASGQDKGESGVLSMGNNYNKGETNTMSFGGFHDEPETNPSGNIISAYDVLISNQNFGQSSEEPSQKDLVQSNAQPTGSNIPKANPKTGIAPKNKEPKASKKLPPNNFPSNVKSLLSTGMLDGVPVKYVSWSREKNLGGSIKGTGYLCGCKECNFSKALNAYEFERHANCKTKHPNNHIYFENGKTIYAVVQELKNTPQELLFDAIQTVTGSQINQKNFRIWKASYQAATRELQRIYGKDEVVMPS